MKVILGQNLNPDGQKYQLMERFKASCRNENNTVCDGNISHGMRNFTSFSGILVLILIINRRFN